MRGFLFITGVIFVVVGLRGLCDPVNAIGIPFSISFNGVSAMNYARASAGGVAIAAGLFMLASVWYDQLLTAALSVCAVILGGMVFGHTISLIADGVPGAALWVSFGAELLGLVQAIYWLEADLSNRAI